MNRKAKTKQSKPKTESWSDVLSAMTGNIQRLDRVTRYSSVPFSFPEATSTHSFWVAFYSALICAHLKEKSPPLADVLLHALTHDAAEAVTGDVVRLLKYSTPELKKEIDRSEKILVNQMFPRILRSLMVTPTKSVKAVVKAADWMSLFHYMRREAARMNMEIIPYYARMLSDLEVATKKAPKWLTKFYWEIRLEATCVYRDCFGKLAYSTRWVRKV